MKNENGKVTTEKKTVVRSISFTVKFDALMEKKRNGLARGRWIERQLSK